MHEVTPLRPEKPADDVVQGLRNIADDLEAGRYGLITSCVVVVGHTYELENRAEDCSDVGERWTSFGLGPRHDPFTVKGLLLTAAGDLSGTIHPE